MYSFPKAFAEETQVKAGSVLDIAVEGNELVIRPIRPRRYDLASLVKAITAKNVHDADESGPSVGRELW